MQIIADILSIASSGAKKTHIMYQANLSYKLLCRYLGEVVDAGLVGCDDGDLYVLTPKGKEFLSKYQEYYDQNRHLKEQLSNAQVQRALLEKMCFNAEIARSKSYSNSFKRVRRVKKSSSYKGVILAAGEGSRMKGITYGAFPKELLPIGNVPTIRFPIEALRLAGINDILIVIAPRTKHGILDGLQGGKKLGVNISYVVQESSEKGLTGVGLAILSTRGRIKPEENFVVACGDSILCDFSARNPIDCIKPLLKVHKSMDSIATVLVYPTKSDPRRFGVVKFQHLHEENGVLYGELERLVEKPSLEVAATYKPDGYNYVVAGYYAFKPKIFSYIEKAKPSAKNEVQITDAMALALENGEKVCAVVHAREKNGEMLPFEYWDVGIPRAYKEANKRLLDVNLELLMSSEGLK